MTLVTSKQLATFHQDECKLWRIHRVNRLLSEGGDVTTLQTKFTAEELLASHPGTEPLFAGGVRCHGGFADDGTYLPPRTRFRVPAIEAWRAHHAETFGTEIIDVPLETWPANFPNEAQARHLIQHGVCEPLIATLTRIGTVEGYGANIRLLQPGDLRRHFVEDIDGTAIDHLGKGLFEAHGRDEAGFEEEAGHRDMWFAARDIAFPQPAPDLDIEAMLERMGFGQGPPGAAGGPPRLLPDDIDPQLEMMTSLMIRVLLIEVQAFHTFAWADAWLSDPDLVDGDGEAARLVSYIRTDETPHVGYLATALTEMRDRTWIGASGQRHPGATLIAALWDSLLDQSLGEGRRQSRKAVLGEVEYWCGKRPNGASILEGFHALATPDAAAA